MKINQERLEAFRAALEASTPPAEQQPGPVGPAVANPQAAPRSVRFGARPATGSGGRAPISQPVAGVSRPSSPLAVEMQRAHNARGNTAPPEPVAPVWDDPSRPPGSAFSAEEWAAARDAAPGSVVYEVHKLRERGLVTIAQADLDVIHKVVLDGSLVIDSRLAAQCPHIGSATVQIEHDHAQLGTFRYHVIRCASARAKASWVDGSVLRNFVERAGGGDPRLEPDRTADRAARYGATPRQR